MSRNEKLDHLFQRWPVEANRGLITDGIVDEAFWTANPIKLLYLMKETHDPENTKGWDLRAFLARGGANDKGKGYTTTWGMTARWTRGITGGVPSWLQTETEVKEKNQAYNTPAGRQGNAAHVWCVRLS
ncbi:MAG: hypothetical protein KAI47_13310 [Deltaproteobacteria bacterium]|nr:hypothetical protein [Deltaproteobacteria bacterium]